MVIKKIFLLITLVIFSFNAFANTPRSTGKYKNWESFVAETEKGKICFAQTVPTKRAPGAIQRDQSKLFVTFRPSENIKDEISITSGKSKSATSVLLRKNRGEEATGSLDTREEDQNIIFNELFVSF